MWPVHTWLPDAHVEAPTGGSVILAAIMLKIGGYGFLRFSLPITPDAEPRARLAGDRAVADRGRLHRLRRAGAGGHEEADRVFVDRAHGLRHARHLHRASTSCATPAALDGARHGHQGAMVQMISHGFVSGAMFLCVGVLYDRMHSRADRATTAASSTRCRGSRRSWCCSRWRTPACRAPRGFVGEFLVILASFQANFWYRVPRGDHADPRRRLHAVAGQARDLRRGGQRRTSRSCTDLNAREFIVLGVLAVGGAARSASGRSRCIDVMDASRRSTCVEPGRCDQALSARHDRHTDHLPSLAPLLPEICPRRRDLRDAAGRPVPERRRSAASRYVLRAARAGRRRASLVTCAHVPSASRAAFDGMFVRDALADVLKLFALPGRRRRAAVLARRTCSDAGCYNGEFYVLVLFALLGMMCWSRPAAC